MKNTKLGSHTHTTLFAIKGSNNKKTIQIYYSAYNKAAVLEKK